MHEVTLGTVLESLRRLWCKVTLQARLVLELQTIDSQARIGKNRGSRMLKSEGSGHLLVQCVAGITLCVSQASHYLRHVVGIVRVRGESQEK